MYHSISNEERTRLRKYHLSEVSSFHSPFLSQNLSVLFPSFFAPCTFPIKAYLVRWDEPKMKLCGKTALFGFTKMAPDLMYHNSTKLCLSSEIIKPLSFLLGCCYSNLDAWHDHIFKSHLYPQEASKLKC